MYYFTDDYLIGVKQIDDDHREFFQLIREVQELLEDEWISDKHDRISDMLSRLERHAEEHFRHEEAYMERIRHPELKLQKQQHAEFIEKIRELGTAADGYDQQELLGDILKLLIKWLYKHILGPDLMIGKLAPSKEWNLSPPVFTEEYLTDIELVDEEHKELFRTIGKLLAIITDDFTSPRFSEIAGLLKELRIFLKSHCKDEEEYMASIRYRELKAHQAAHETFIARLDELYVNEINAEHEHALKELMAFLTEGLVDHILHMDIRIGKAH